MHTHKCSPHGRLCNGMKERVDTNVQSQKCGQNVKICFNS